MILGELRIWARLTTYAALVQGMFRVCSEYVQGMYRVWSEYVQSISLLFSSSLFGGQQRPLMHCALRAQSFLQLFNTFSLFFVSREKISLLHGFPKRQCRFHSSNVNETLHKLSVPKSKMILPVHQILPLLGNLAESGFLFSAENGRAS